MSDVRAVRVHGSNIKFDGFRERMAFERLADSTGTVSAAAVDQAIASKRAKLPGTERRLESLKDKISAVVDNADANRFDHWLSLGDERASTLVTLVEANLDQTPDLPFAFHTAQAEISAKVDLAKEAAKRLEHASQGEAGPKLKSAVAQRADRLEEVSRSLRDAIELGDGFIRDIAPPATAPDRPLTDSERAEIAHRLPTILYMRVSTTSIDGYHFVRKDCAEETNAILRALDAGKSVSMRYRIGPHGYNYETRLFERLTQLQDFVLEAHADIADAQGAVSVRSARDAVRRGYP